MADLRITQLPVATTPLAGTEPTVVVQGGATRRAPASEIGKINGAVDLTGTDPAAPPANTVRLFRRAIANRQMPAFVGPSGLDTALQPFFARNKVGRWSPIGNAVNVNSDGLAAISSVGTATNRTTTTTNRFTRMRRVGYVSAATAGSLAVARHDQNQFYTGNGSGDGGFHMVARFGFSALTADARALFGMRGAVAPTNVEPSTITNHIGIGRGAADTTLRLFYGGSAAQPPIDLGPSFPANTTNVDMYELALFSPPSQAGVVNWQVTRLNTGHVAEGQLSGDATVLPAATVGLSAFAGWVSNNATAAAVALDLVSLYIETDF